MSANMPSSAMSSLTSEDIVSFTAQRYDFSQVTNFSFIIWESQPIWNHTPSKLLFLSTGLYVQFNSYLIMLPT